MDDRQEVTEFINRIVCDSKIASARERDELRRELESHFAEAAAAPDALRQAMERFGHPTAVSSALERLHRHGRLMTRVLRLLVAVTASSLFAVAVQLLVNLRRDPRTNGFRLGHAFPRSVAFSAIIIVVLVAAWELDIESLCTRLERRPMRVVFAILLLALGMQAFHSLQSTTVSPRLAFSASTVAVVIWTCTIAILAGTDRVFARVFAPSRH